jgi:hypothetical protein
MIVCLANYPFVNHGKINVREYEDKKHVRLQKHVWSKDGGRRESSAYTVLATIFCAVAALLICVSLSGTLAGSDSPCNSKCVLTEGENEVLKNCISIMPKDSVPVTPAESRDGNPTEGQ